MPTFRVLKGKHQHGKNKLNQPITYKAGDVFFTPKELDIILNNKRNKVLERISEGDVTSTVKSKSLPNT